jgi:hypothetical protein
MQTLDNCNSLERIADHTVLSIVRRGSGFPCYTDPVQPYFSQQTWMLTQGIVDYANRPPIIRSEITPYD